MSTQPKELFAGALSKDRRWRTNSGAEICYGRLRDWSVEEVEFISLDGTVLKGEHCHLPDYDKKLIRAWLPKEHPFYESSPDIPTANGFYWARHLWNGGLGVFTIVEFNADYPEQIWTCGTDDYDELDEWRDFSGPLTPPIAE